MATAVIACPNCGASVLGHCRCKGCNWFKCPRCLSYGRSAKRYVKVGR